MMNSREILEFITDNEKVTLSKLSQLMGIKRAQPLYDIRDGKIKSISANYADKILSVFPEYSRSWLITGEGQPFSKNNEENLSDLTKRFLEEVERMGVSFYDIAKSTGVQEAMFTKIKKGIQEPSKKFLSKFAECFSDANMEYIYLGKEDGNNEDDKIIRDVTRRFYEVMDSLSLNDYKVYTGIEGIIKNMMSKLRQGHTEEVSVKILMPFCEAYPQVNANYILTGKGDMFLKEHPAEESKEIKASQIKVAYENIIKDKEKQIEALREEINRLTRENDRLVGENSIMREQIGIGERKSSNKSA